jgi:hypothetical protein
MIETENYCKKTYNSFNKDIDFLLKQIYSYECSQETEIGCKQNLSKTLTSQEKIDDNF